MRTFCMTTSSTIFMQCAPEATEFGEISRSPILVPTESSYTTSYQRLIRTYLLSYIISEVQPLMGPKSLYLATPLAFALQRRGSPGTIFVIFSVDVNGWLRYQMAQKHCQKFQPTEQGARALQTRDDRQTDGRQHNIANVNVSSRSLKSFTEKRTHPLTHSGTFVTLVAKIPALLLIGFRKPCFVCVILLISIHAIQCSTTDSQTQKQIVSNGCIARRIHHDITKHRH